MSYGSVSTLIKSDFLYSAEIHLKCYSPVA